MNIYFFIRKIIVWRYIFRVALSTVYLKRNKIPKRFIMTFWSKLKMWYQYFIAEFSELLCHDATLFFHHQTYFRNEFILHETTAPSFFHCENMCLHEFQCRDFGYNSSSELCRMNAADFRFSLVDSLTECEILCAVDATCLGYFFKADEKKCRLSNSNVSKSTPWCEYCIFSTKQCSNGKYNSTHCLLLSPSALQML